MINLNLIPSQNCIGILAKLYLIISSNNNKDYHPGNLCTMKEIKTNNFKKLDNRVDLLVSKAEVFIIWHQNNRRQNIFYQRDCQILAVFLFVCT
jgi:hypothetical protein